MNRFVAVMALLLLATPALAQDTTISLPYGDVLAAIAGIVGMVLVILIGVALNFLVKFLPPWAQAVITKAQIDKIQALAADAVEYGVQATAGAVKGKELTINVGNELIANAVQNAIDTWEPKLIDALGSDGVKVEVIKALEKAGVLLPPESTINKVLASPEVSSVNP